MNCKLSSRLFVSAAFIGAILPFPATGETTNLMPVADAALRNSAPTANYGSAASLPVGVGKFGSPVNRGLFRFDLAAIPTNALVTRATLVLTVNTDPTPAASFNLHRALSGWDEMEVTWGSRSASALWGNGGGQAGIDYATTPSATAILSLGSGLFTSAGLMADVQLWIQNPAANFGWFLLAAGEPAGTGKQIASREDTNTPPTLQIEYTLPSLPASPILSDTAVTDGQIHFRFLAEANRSYTVEYCDALETGSWSVLTNIAASATNTVVHVSTALLPGSRCFRARTPAN